MSKPIVSVLEVSEDGEAVCDACRKPVPMTLRVRWDDGSINNMCRSDFLKILRLKAQGQKAREESEGPLFQTNDRA